MSASCACSADMLGAEPAAAGMPERADQATRTPSSLGSPVVAGDLCLTCLARAGRPRATVLHAVVCGPCWAAHGGSPDAHEIGPAPTLTVPSWDPRDQQHWLSALRRQDWVGDIRADGRANLLTVARLVALSAEWSTLESRPTWTRLVTRSGLSERTVARWLQELRIRGWLAHLEHGSTPAHRPTVLAHLCGNRAAVYGLRIPLSPEEARHRALEQLLARLADDLTHPASADTTEAAPDHPSPAPTPHVETLAQPHSTAPAARSAHSGPAADSAPPDEPDQHHPGTPGDTNGSPSWSFSPEKKDWVDGFSRASKIVDNLGTNPEKDQKNALRASQDHTSRPDWELTVPTSGFAMLIAADWLQRRLPVFSRCSRKLIRHLCKPYWRAGWTNRDILHAMDHRPSVFAQTTGVLICPEHIAAPKAFIASRLAAWRTPDGAILPGHYTSRLTHATATKTARTLVATRHGRAGAALLRPGEHTLTTHRITEHGRASRPPANPTTRAAAKATLAATLTATRQQRAHRRHPQ